MAVVGWFVLLHVSIYTPYKPKLNGFMSKQITTIGNKKSRGVWD